MCPGGYVVNASSEPGRLAVNGMSYHDRGSRNANSALIVTVTPEDFSASGPLAGVEFQRELEEKACNLAGKDSSSALRRLLPESGLFSPSSGDALHQQDGVSTTENPFS